MEWCHMKLARHKLFQQKTRQWTSPSISVGASPVAEFMDDIFRKASRSWPRGPKNDRSFRLWEQMSSFSHRNLGTELSPVKSWGLFTLDGEPMSRHWVAELSSIIGSSSETWPAATTVRICAHIYCSNMFNWLLFEFSFVFHFIKTCEKNAHLTFHLDVFIWISKIQSIRQAPEFLRDVGFSSGTASGAAGAFAAAALGAGGFLGGAGRSGGSRRGAKGGNLDATLGKCRKSHRMMRIKRRIAETKRWKCCHKNKISSSILSSILCFPSIFETWLSHMLRRGCVALTPGTAHDQSGGWGVQQFFDFDSHLCCGRLVQDHICTWVHETQA